MIDRIRHLIFDHALLKVASLLIAILMWYGVAHEPIAEISVRVPIEFTEPPKGLDYSSDAIPQAEIRLRGPARLLRDFPEESVHLIVDLHGATPGEHTYPLDARQVHVPHDVDVIEIFPSRLHLVFDRSETRQVPVKPRVVGNLPPGYRIQSIVANPSTLTINGPERHVDAVEDALTDAVDVTGLAGTSTYDTRAYLPDPRVHLADSNAIRVTVTTVSTSTANSSPSSSGAH